MKVIINAQAFHAAQQCAADKDVRFYLNGVYLAPNGDCVGTNGHVAAITPKAGYFADIPHRLIKIKDAIPAKAMHIELDTDTRVASFIAQNFSEIKRVGYEIETEEFRYPDYTRLTPKKKGSIEVVALAGEYLTLAAKVFRGSKGIRFEFDAQPGGVAVLTTPLNETVMLVMPIRL